MRRDVDTGGGRVTVIGTAHVSRESVDEVGETIAELEPDLVAVELDENRLESLENESGWRELNVSRALLDGKGPTLVLNLVLSIYQRRLGLGEGVKPGEDMLAAIKAARSRGIEYALIDRDINHTFSRLREEMSFREKLRFAGSMLVDSPELDVEELKQRQMIDSLVEQLDRDFPSIGRVFLEERNRYMARQLADREFDHAVVVVGAAHVEGLVKELEEPTEPPAAGRGIPWFRMLRYGLPMAIIGMLAYSFLRIDFSTGVEAVGAWILINGVLAMLGAVIARSHVLTWVSSFIAAPITSLDPAIGAGMVAGYVEARFYPPTVGELEDIVYINSYRELWGNQVGRILLTFVFVSIGSALATFISAGYIASLLSV